MDFLLPYESYRRRYPLKVEALYHAIKDAVTEGRLSAGAALPSSREVARLYGLSRGTVNTVYETLASEGYLRPEVGRGTRVCYNGRGSASRTESAQAEIRLSDWGSRLHSMPLRTAGEEEVPQDRNGRSEIRFETGIPDTRYFPFDQWNRILYAQVREMGSPLHQELFQSQGHIGLREAVAAYLNRYRGLQAAPEQVVIVNGSMQAIALIAQLLINPGDSVAVENPGYSGTRRAVTAQGGRLAPIPAGQVTAAAVRAAKARLLFVTPGRQFPTGSVMPLETRIELLDWAAAGGCIIVEDDYDSEFRHRGRPLEPLIALDRTGASVVYLGTFTKTMPPGHRLGYAVLPPRLVEPFVKAKQLYEPHPTALLEQRAMARFMQSGHYGRHLRRMKRVYGSRFHLLKQELESRLGDWFDVVPSDSGLHLFVWWKGHEAGWNEFRKACRKAGVAWTETESYFTGDPVPSACFGFSHLTEEEISVGVARMRQVLQSLSL